MKGWKKIFHGNGNQKRAGVERKKVAREKGHYILIKGSVYQEDITVTYASKVRAHK